MFTRCSPEVTLQSTATQTFWLEVSEDRVLGFRDSRKLKVEILERGSPKSDGNFPLDPWLTTEHGGTGATPRSL